MVKQTNAELKKVLLEKGDLIKKMDVAITKLRNKLQLVKAITDENFI